MSLNKLSVIFLGLSAVASLLKGIFAAYLLDLEQFGQYAVLMSFVAIFTLLFSFAVEPRYLRSGSRVLALIGSDKAFDVHFLKYVSGVFLNFLLLILPILAVLALFKMPVEAGSLSIFLALSLSVFNLTVSSIRLSGSYFLYSLLLLLKNSLVIFLFLAAADELKEYQNFILMELVVTILIVVFGNYGKLYLIRPTLIGLYRYKYIVKSGWGYSTSYLVRSGLFMIDRPLVSLSQGTAIAGMYAMYLIPVQVALGVLGMFSIYFQPWAIRKVNSGDYSGVLKFSQLYFGVSLFLSLSGVFLLYYFHDAALGVLSFEADIHSIMLAAVIAALVVMNVFDLFYLVVGRGKHQLIVSAASAVIYCIAMLYYYYVDSSYTLLLNALVVARFFALIYGFVFVNGYLIRR